MNKAIDVAVNICYPYASDVYQIATEAMGKLWTRGTPYAVKVAEWAAPYWSQAIEIAAPYAAQVSPLMAKVAVATAPAVAKVSTLFAQNIANRQWMSVYCGAVACEASGRGILRLVHLICQIAAACIGRAGLKDVKEDFKQVCLHGGYAAVFAAGAVIPMAGEILPLVSIAVNTSILRSINDCEYRLNHCFNSTPKSYDSLEVKDEVRTNIKELRRLMASERYTTAYFAQRGFENIAAVGRYGF